jgi:gas vesicle protein
VIDAKQGTLLWRGIGIGTGIGAAMMFLLDPQRGRRRRALVRDKAVHAVRRTERVFGARSRDWGNRARGAAAQVKKRLRRREVSDDVLEERVRAEMGHVVANPGSLRVTARRGRATLSGAVLAVEEDPLLSRVSAIPGVLQIENRLEAHQRPDVSGLQGAGPRAS